MKRTRKKTRILLVANGGLRASANEKFWPAQVAMERELSSVVGSQNARPQPCHRLFSSFPTLTRPTNLVPNMGWEPGDIKRVRLFLGPPCMIRDRK